MKYALIKITAKFADYQGGYFLCPKLLLSEVRCNCNHEDTELDSTDKLILLLI